MPITYYIESGTVEIQWEAMLPVSLATVFSTALQKPNSSSLSSPPAPNLSSEQSTAYMDNMDSVAFTAPHVANMAKMFSKVGTRSRDSSDRTPTGSGRRRSVDSAGLAEANPLALTLQQATARAEALMANAAGGSLDNLLISPRGQTQFVGALIMLDPEVFADRWRMSAVAASDVVIIQMTREGLDQFLAQNPLAQVHLRSSMAMTRSEIMKLEALEKIANVHRKRMKAERKKKQQQQQGTGAAVAPSKSRSWRLADVFGIPFDEAVRMASGEVTVAPAGAKPGELTRTATLDMFALVSRLRAGAEGLMKSTTLPKTPEEGS